MEFKIEKGIPINSTENEGHFLTTLNGMSIGDSVFVKTSTMRNNFRFCARRIGAMVVTRKVEGGYRVWLMKHPINKEGETA